MSSQITYVDVILPLALPQAYTYAVPIDLVPRYVNVAAGFTLYEDVVLGAFEAAQALIVSTSVGTVNGFLNITASSNINIVAGPFTSVAAIIGGVVPGALTMTSNTIMNLYAVGAMTLTSVGGIALNAGLAVEIGAGVSILLSTAGSITLKNTLAATDNIVIINSTATGVRAGVSFYDGASAAKVNLYKDTNNDFVLRMGTISGGTTVMTVTVSLLAAAGR